MNMVQILSDAIQDFREGDWNLHLNLFSSMMPYLAIYDHTNYSRWGPVYLSNMKQLAVTAPDVHRDFAEGNFVVKRSSHRFNQVPVDQATEWQNRMCKLSSGIFCITRNDTAQDRFCITWSERSYISEQTKKLYGLQDSDHEAISTRKEGLPSRVVKDEDNVQSLIRCFKQFSVFNMELPDHVEADHHD